jgi:hypothetical protein
MAEKLGRLLTRREQVHHIDGNPSNNDINNLMLMSSGSEHRRYEHEQNQKYIQGLEQKIQALKQENERLKCQSK